MRNATFEGKIMDEWEELLYCINNELELYYDYVSVELKSLLEELQIYIASIDEEGYNIVTREYKEKYFIETMEEVNKGVLWI